LERLAIFKSFRHPAGIGIPASAKPDRHDDARRGHAIRARRQQVPQNPRLETCASPRSLVSREGDHPLITREAGYRPIAA
jgi:hypothetical protein